MNQTTYWTETERRDYFVLCAKPPIKLTAHEYGGGSTVHTTDRLGYIHKVFANRYHAHTYGVVNPDCFGQQFDNIDEAKAYVETQALTGIVANKLTR